MPATGCGVHSLLVKTRVGYLERRRRHVAQGFVVVALLGALSASAALGGVQRLPITRARTFSGALHRGGTVVGRFACRIRIRESRRTIAVTATPESGWLTVPGPGRWRLFYELGGLDPTGGAGGAMGGTYRPVGHRNRIAFLPLESTSQSVPRPTGPTRYACGLFLRRVGESPDGRVYRKLYLTVSWPRFAFLGINAPA